MALKSGNKGAKMVLEQYIKWLEMEENGAEASESDKTKSRVMKELFKKFKENSQANTVTGLSENAENILTKAVELWPIFQQGFAKDPMEDAIESEPLKNLNLSQLIQ